MNGLLAKESAMFDGDEVVPGMLHDHSVSSSIVQAKPQVVFLDDEQNYVDGIRRALRDLRNSWDIQYFTKPEQALEAVEKLEDVVVVTDWMMPVMDGIQFQHESRRRIFQKKLTSAYYIILTGKIGTDDAVTALESGFDDYIRKPFHVGELVARVKVGLRVLESERRLKQSARALEALAMTDPLTGLYNRRHGARVFQEELSRAVRGKQHLSTIMADIDYFKRINDTYGHDAGDRVLTHFAAVLKYTLRNYDVAIRWGGEEFLIICPHTDSQEVKFVTDRLLRNVRSMQVPLANGESIRITASFGTCSTDLLELDEMSDPIGKADQMLYLAKSEGRDRVFHFQMTPL